MEDPIEPPDDDGEHEAHDALSPRLHFPQRFCCNCGSTDCAVEVQVTRVWRFFALHAGESTFQLHVPVCARCRRTLRRRPPGFFLQLMVLSLLMAAGVVGLWTLGRYVSWPPTVEVYLPAAGAVLGALGTFIFYRLRRARAPRTSFYQPVRIRKASVQFAGVMGGPGHVEFLELAFTNLEYLHRFVDANQDAIAAGHLAVSSVRA